MDDRTHKPSARPAAQLVMFDAILPDAMALRAEALGVKKAVTDPLSLFVLAVLGGAFISFGAIFATTVSAGAITGSAADGAAFSAQLPFGLTKLLTGLSFSVGLILVLIAGAELFTGNTMIVMAWASRKVTTRALLLNWVVVFCGNAAGAILTAALMFFTTQYTSTPRTQRPRSTSCPRLRSASCAMRSSVSRCGCATAGVARSRRSS